MSLEGKKCQPCEGYMKPLDKEVIQQLLVEVPEWHVDKTGVHFIERVFEFKNYYQTIAFVNAVAFIANRENHHPDLSVHYNKCIVQYKTHAINGLSENDFICAQKINKLFE